jgi:hypothetical protein
MAQFIVDFILKGAMNRQKQNYKRTRDLKTEVFYFYDQTCLGGTWIFSGSNELEISRILKMGGQNYFKKYEMTIFYMLSF